MKSTLAGFTILVFLLGSCGKSADSGKESQLEKGSCTVSPSSLDIHHSKVFTLSIRLEGESSAPKFVQSNMEWNYPSTWTGVKAAQDFRPFSIYTEKQSTSGNVLLVNQVYQLKSSDVLANQELRELQNSHPILHTVVVRTSAGKTVACEVPANVMP